MGLGPVNRTPCKPSTKERRRHEPHTHSMMYSFSFRAQKGLGWVDPFVIGQYMPWAGIVTPFFVHALREDVPTIVTLGTIRFPCPNAEPTFTVAVFFGRQHFDFFVVTQAFMEKSWCKERHQEQNNNNVKGLHGGFSISCFAFLM